MPEIDVMLFDLAHLFLLFKVNKEADEDFFEYEENNQICMAKIRLNLFSEENTEPQKAFI
ncbi:MAG: hypothetical protein NC191_05035 [Muribaculaceae bacterium]|nr:hypothetical protein [Muribaculaceae bacterium]